VQHGKVYPGIVCRRIPEIVEAIEGIVSDVKNEAGFDQLAFARYILDPSFGIEEGWVPGLVLRGDGNNVKRGYVARSAMTTVKGLSEVPYLVQQFLGKAEPTDKFLMKHRSEEEIALLAQVSP
jgi:hypothetical protein